MTRAGGIAIGSAATIAIVLALGCDDSLRGIDATDAGATPRTDAGPALFEDGGASDGGVRGMPPDADAREGAADDLACFDGRDNDSWEGLDCDDVACSTRAICCVGEASDACCGAPAPITTWSAATASCGDGPADACASVAALGTAFGSPLPAIVGGAIVPNGEPTADSGLVLAQQVAPRTSTVRVEATIAAPMGCSGCVDGVAVGLADGALGDARIAPLVAVQVSGSLGEAMLVSGSAVLWRAPLADAEPHLYTLVTRADGSVDLLVDGTLVLVDDTRPHTTTIELPTRDLDVVIYGRTTNRGVDTTAARVTALTVSSSSCDMPAALARGVATLLTPVTAPFPGSRARAPSVGVRTDPADARLAFESQGSVWLARPTSDGGWVVPSDANPALLAGEPGVEDGASDPTLLALDDRWLLVWAAPDPDAGGRQRLFMVEGDAGFGEAFDPEAKRPVLTSLPTGMDELDGPMAFRDASDAIVLVARASRMREGGGRDTEIVLLRGATGDAGLGFSVDAEVCGTGCDRASLTDDEAGPVTSTLHAPRTSVIDAFDRDEVAAPSVVRTPDGIYRLYFAGRRGTRWAIGMLVSYDLEFFRAPSPSAVLAASGEGRDALGVLDPEPVLRGGELVLLHTGTDGVGTYVLAAEQRLE